jgi:two-component system response regulator (stage 0 sporulation protein A)
MKEKLVEEKSLQILIVQILHNLGIPSHIKGYNYMKEGIVLLYKNPNMKITKELYPQIAIKYSTTSSRVECAIRHAIEKSWTRGNLELIDEIFGYSIDVEKSKPTNSEFIITIAEKLKLI